LLADQVNYNDCKIVAVPGKYKTNYLTFATQKDSQYLEMFNHHLTKLFERGFFDIITPKLPLQKCSSPGGVPVRFNQSVGAFLLLGVGLSTGLGFMLIEHFFKTLGLNGDISRFYESQTKGWVK
jgi:hypothetical protein